MVLGHSTLVAVEENNTALYRLDMAAEVADSNGNPVAGSNVTISMWPELYYTGVWYDADLDPNTEKCVRYFSGGPFANEDRDEDLILDQQDNSVPPNGSILDAIDINEDINLDGELNPHNSASGTAPSTVVTDNEGIGGYKLTYLKQYGGWIDARAQARTKVQGTETTGTLRFAMPFAKQEAKDCLLPASPYVLTLSGTLDTEVGGVPDLAVPAKIQATGAVYRVKNIFSASYDIYGTQEGYVQFCNPDATTGLCQNTDVGEYYLPTCLPKSAVTLRDKLHSDTYPADWYVYDDQITVTDTDICTIAGASYACESVGATFPIRVLVDCSGAGCTKCP